MQENGKIQESKVEEYGEHDVSFKGELKLRL